MSAKSTQKKASKQPAEHPKYAEMIIQALHALKDRNGSSRQALDKYVKNHFKVGDKASHFIKMALKRGVENGQFINTKGSGASGSFKVNKKCTESKGSQRPGEEDQNRRSSQQTKNKEGRRERKDRPQTSRENQEIAG